MTLRRLAGKTENAAPVVALITQFGGGKTHTLTALYHLINSPTAAVKNDGVKSLLAESQAGDVPKTRVAVFVGNAWDAS
jgi:predicted AAA+ superfamily ATPase